MKESNEGLQENVLKREEFVNRNEDVKSKK